MCVDVVQQLKLAFGNSDALHSGGSTYRNQFGYGVPISCDDDFGFPTELDSPHQLSQLCSCCPYVYDFHGIPLCRSSLASWRGVIEESGMAT